MPYRGAMINFPAEVLGFSCFVRMTVLSISSTLKKKRCNNISGLWRNFLANISDPKINIDRSSTNLNTSQRI